MCDHCSMLAYFCISRYTVDMYTSRFIRFCRSALGRVFKAVAYTTFFAFVCVAGTSNGVLAHVAISVWLVLCIPALLVLLVVIAFAIYHGVKHGDMTMDYAPDPVTVIRTTHMSVYKKQRDWCPICQKNSGCRLGRNPVTGIAIHVFR